MMQSSFPVAVSNGLRIAMIMDGASRWAPPRGMPRLVGHRAGAENVRRVVSACLDRRLRYLTLCAFSTENWGLPQPEVDGRIRVLAALWGIWSALFLAVPASSHAASTALLPQGA